MVEIVGFPYLSCANLRYQREKKLIYIDYYRPFRTINLTIADFEINFIQLMAGYVYLGAWGYGN